MKAMENQSRGKIRARRFSLWS